MLLANYRHRGRHRAEPAHRPLAQAATVAAVAVAAPLTLAPVAAAAPGHVWDRVAACESGGNWSTNTGNGYQGGLQFAPSTWRGFGGAEFASSAHQASRAEQIEVAERVLAQQGWGAWPVCSRKAGARGTAANVRTESPPQPDQALRPPGPTKAGISAGISGTAVPDGYRVKAGDTLGVIAARYGVDGGWKTLATVNGVGNPHRIKVGLVLR